MTWRLGALDKLLLVLTISALACTVADATCLRATFDLISATQTGHGIQCEDQPCFEWVLYEIDWVCKTSPTVTYCVTNANSSAQVKLYYICDDDVCVEDPAADREFYGSESGYKTQHTLPPGWSACTP